VLKPVLLPMENKLDNYSTCLIDTPGSFDDNSDVSAEMKAKIKSANAILLLYDMSNEETVKALNDFWLPLITSANTKVPVIIVGNKLDLVRANPNLSQFLRIGKILKPILRQFEQVQMGIEVSAEQSKNIFEMLYLAQTSIIFPLSTLMHLPDRVLTRRYKKALCRIFRILDNDNDGKLSYEELNSLQQHVFENQLTQEDFKAFLDIVKSEAPEHHNSRYITLEGFYVIHKRVLELMKIKSCWITLKYYDYDINLDLDESLFEDSLVVGNFSTVELKPAATQFLKKLFNKFAEGEVLTLQSLHQIFEPLEEIPLEEIRKYSNFSFAQKFTHIEWETFWR
jgi:mitochondrial Rho GTPase 1